MSKNKLLCDVCHKPIHKGEAYKWSPFYNMVCHIEHRIIFHTTVYVLRRGNEHQLGRWHQSRIATKEAQTKVK